MGTTNSAVRMGRFHGSARAAGLFAGALLAFGALATPARAQELHVEKVVSQVNGSAPPATEVISVSPGDSVSYGISVSSVVDLGGTDVTIRDVFESQVLEFQEASSGDCTSSGGEVTCTLTLDDEGATEVELTFQVLEVENCRRLVNTVEVAGEQNLTASAEAEIEACPAGGGNGDGQGDDGEGNGDGNGASPDPGEGQGQPNTAMGSTSSRTGVSAATIAGLLLIMLAVSTALRPLRVRVD